MDRSDQEFYYETESNSKNNYQRLYIVLILQRSPLGGYCISVAANY